MPSDVTEEVLGVIADTQRIPREKIALDSRFEELGMDSMDAVNILFALEEKFDITIPDEAAKQIRSDSPDGRWSPGNLLDAKAVQ